MRALIFGNTPMAHRLAFYLEHYGEAKDQDVTVIRVELDSRASLAEIQRKVWNTYVGDTSGRVDLIINAHEEASLVHCETDPTVAWRSNTRHAAWIAYAARTADVPLIQLSTDHVFRGDRGPYAANRDIRDETPVNVYGVTKWYAEQIAMSLYPKRWRDEHPDGRIEPGTTIIRTSDLYGLDVPWSVPATLARADERERSIHTHGVVRNPAKVNPSFIGEVAFIIARNILLSPQSLGEPVVHVAPDDPPIDWASYLHSVECDVVFQAKGESKKARTSDRLLRQGPSRGLVPTSGWFLPSGQPKKSFDDYLNEYQSGSPPSFVRYWNAD